MQTVPPGHDKSLTAKEFFELWEKGDSAAGESCGKASRSVRAAGAKAHSELFEKIKTEMVMRIYGVSPEKALQIIASASMPLTTNN